MVTLWETTGRSCVKSELIFYLIPMCHFFVKEKMTEDDKTPHGFRLYTSLEIHVPVGCYSVEIQ